MYGLEIRNKMNIVAIYAGRFQPFGPHHAKAFSWLCDRFGRENCWISTSDSTDDRSPLSFAEKVSIIKKYGIDNIIKSVSPYRLTDSRFDPNNTILMVLLGEKDEGRIQYVKQDGTLGYYKEYYGQLDLEPMSKSGYVIVAPHISIKHNGNEVSGTYLRKSLPYMSQSDFTRLMGWYDESIHRLFKNKFSEELNDFSEFMSNPSIKQKAPKRRISHVYEDLSIDDMERILAGLMDGSIPAYEKFDGINLKVRIKNNEIVSARTNNDLSSPLTVTQLGNRYIDRPLVKLAFEQAQIDMGAFLKSVPNRPDCWINIEIVNPILDSGYKYGFEPLIVVHNFLDDSGHKIDGLDIDAHLPSVQSNYTVIGPNRLKIPNMPIYLAQARSDLRRSKNLEDTINKISYTILSKVNGYKAVESNIRNRLEQVGRQVSNCPDPKLRQKYFDNLQRIDFTKILPFEGIVFDWNGKTYKLTGYFKYQNQILHLFRK